MPRLFRSTTFRMAALVFLLQVAGAAGLLMTVGLLTRAQLTAFAQAQATGLRDALLADRHGGEAALAERIEEERARGRFPGSVTLLVDRSGRRLAGNLDAWPPSLPLGQPRTVTELFRIGRDRSERMRIVATPLPNGARLLTGHVIEGELRFATLLSEAMLSAVALAVAFAAFAGWTIARLIERKLGTTVATARAVADGQLSQRVPPEPGDDAFADLADAVNSMLDRIATLMNELKIATDGLAHDLRSPLTRLRSTLERALADSGEGARSAIVRGIEEGDRLLAMLDTALRITRAEAGLGRAGFEETDLSRIVADMVEVYGPAAEDGGLTIAAEAEPGLFAFVHRELLGQALANLIDNGLKYGGGRITVSACRTDRTIMVVVADEGPGIEAALRPEALRRFGRLDAARTESGAGLGLSLAAAVAKLHHGRLDLRDNMPGVRVELTIGSGPDDTSLM